MKNKYILGLIFLVLLLPITLFSACGNTTTIFETTYPDDFKIVGRLTNGSVFAEETFVKEGNLYYYKYQAYTEDFAQTDSTMIEYAAIFDGEDFVTYSFADSSWQQSTLIDFSNNWFGLDLYAKAPSIEFYSNEKQADSVVNGTTCFVYTADNVTYKISQDEYSMVWDYFVETPSLLLHYQVQSLTLTNVFDGITKNGLN